MPKLTVELDKKMFDGISEIAYRDRLTKKEVVQKGVIARQMNKKNMKRIMAELDFVFGPKFVFTRDLPKPKSDLEIELERAGITE